MKRLYATTLLLVLAKFSGAQLQSSVERSCPGENVTFTCAISSLAHRWESSALDMARSLVPGDQGGVVSDPPFQFNVTEATGSYITSTATVTATTDLNGTLIACQDGIGMHPDQSNTINVRGPPSIPTLSCIDLSEDVSGAVNVTVSWTLSGGDSADFYLINIITNASQTLYGGLLNITNASVTQHELKGFMAGYEYNITVRGVNCGNLEGSESEPLTIAPQVPTTPDNFVVCAMYDKVNRTLQIIEATWNELNPVTITENCANGQDIRASYDVIYTTASGTLITTCVVDGTECSNGRCHHELQNNIADSRCQPPVSQFNDESVTVSLTARNIVGESNTSESQSLNGTNVNILEVRVDSTDPSNAIVECAFFTRRYNCTIQYGTDPSYTNLTDVDTLFTVRLNATITLTQRLERNTDYYYIVSAESGTQCVRVRGRFRTECTVTDLRLSDSETTIRGGTVDQRCIDKGFASNTSISSGVVCYSGTMAGSRALYICDNDTQGNEVTRVCQNDGIWNGTIPSCPVSRRLDRWHISLIVIGAVALVLAMLHINLPCRKMKWWQILLNVIVTALWIIVVALWIAVGVVMSDPPNENLRDPIWRRRRVALITSACFASISAITCTAVVVCVHVYHKRRVSHVTLTKEKPKDKVIKWLRILLSVISTVFWVIGVIFWYAVGFVVSNPPNGDTRDPVWQLHRNALSYTALATSILAVICTASIVWICVYRNKRLECWKIVLIVFSTISWLIGVALWCTVGVVVVSPPDGNVRDPAWQCFRNGLVISAFIVSIVAFICAAVVVWYRVCCNRGKIKKGWQIALLVIAAILTVTGVGLWIAVGVVVYSVDDENKNKLDESEKMEELKEVKDSDGVGSAVNELSGPSERKEVQLELTYADVEPSIPTTVKMPPITDSNVQYSLLTHDQHKDPAGTLSASLDMTPPPQSPVDTEDSPPPPLPLKQSSAADTLQSPKLPEGREPYQSEMDAPYPPPPKANQGDNTLQSHPPNTHQQAAESKPEEQK